MHPFPHHYRVSASGTARGEVKVSADGLPGVSTEAPPEFDGPGGHWSPEMLLVGAVADCFVLSFRGVARASRLEWTHLKCDVEGTLDRADGVNRFTRLTISPVLTIQAEDDRDKARRCLDKAEHVCLITNSLNADKTLDARIEVARDR